MSLRDQMKQIIDAYSRRRDALQHDHTLIDIFEGNLLQYVESDLQRQLSPQSYEQCRHRVPPINLLTKIVDKMSTIYEPEPVRRIVKGTGTATDEALLAWYVEKLAINEPMQQGLELYNLCKATLLQPFVNNGAPQLRSVPNDCYFVLGMDPIDPKRVTHVVTFDACADGTRFVAYTDTEFLIFNEKEEIDTAALVALENPEGVNPYGVLPFTYRANARFAVAPTQDTDVLRMVKLVPLLLADLNYAVMFQAFSIIYGINVDDENLKMAPNSFWRFKQDSTTEGKPEIGSIKPQVDIAEVMGLVQSELALWLNTRGIRPGAVGKLDADQFASGISKLIDEMDTIEIRAKLVNVFTAIEADFWSKLMHKYHPVWVQRGVFEQKGLFTAGARVETVFSKQLPITSRGQVVKDQKEEVDAGFTTRKRAIQTLNPSMSEDEVDELMVQIDEEQDGAAPDEPPPPGDGKGGGNADGPDAPPAGDEGAAGGGAGMGDAEGDAA